MELLEIYLQSQTHKIISQDISSGMLNHAYLINSKDEYILSVFSRFVAKEIFCLNDNAPCDNCVSCDKVNHSNMVDLIIYPKTDKNLMVDDINEIVNDCYIRPMDANYKVYILQADCEKEAETFANTIRETFGDLDIVIQPVGPVIGAHCGPGTIGLVFHAKEK